MKKLSQINEGMFSGIIRRSNSDQVKKEDEITYVDLGGSILWMEEDVIINGKDTFTFDEIKDFTIGEWRRPTNSEADELFSNHPKYEYLKDTNEIKITHSNGNFILLTDTFPHHYWELDSSNSSDVFWNTFDIHADGKFFPHSAYSMAKKEKSGRLRLVKKK